MADATPPRSFIALGGALRLSNPGQLELLRGVAERGVPLRTTVRGFSMTPFIRDGDVATIAPMDRDPRVGDVTAVALPQAGRMAVHRVVDRLPQGWLVRGDNCPEPDGVFAREAFVGRVVRVERGGRAVRFGAARQGLWIAALSRGGWLGRARRARGAPRGAAGSVARRIQALPAYRRAARRLAPAAAVGPAGPDDLRAIGRRFGARVMEQGAAAGSNPRATRLVARHGARVVGFVELVDHHDLEGPWRGWWLFSLLVWPAYRGMGLGERLTLAVAEEARRRGAGDLQLVVFADEARAVRLYRKLGFTPAELPELEALLAAEAEATGRRRRALRLELTGGEV